MPGPLEGVRVIDLTAVLLGPFATQHMADMGADVIKVEPPEGDLLRVSGGSMGRDKSMGPIYMAANRNKRSITSTSVLSPRFVRYDKTRSFYRPAER